MSEANDKQTIWKALSDHSHAMRNIHMRDLFRHDPTRGKKLVLDISGIRIDYSKHIITSETLDLLFNYAKASNIENSTNAMFAGEKINTTENRAVLHTALRSAPDDKLNIDDIDIVQQVHEELEKIELFVTAVHTGTINGWTGKAFDTFVNIGIGGSDLGPKLVVNALEPFRVGNTRSFFVSNIDYQQITALQKTIDPETTLFIVSSKSFNTSETQTNAETLRSWMQQTGCTATNKHFVAVTSNADAATEFGIDPKNIFNIWDWVGGRYSLWSATGLPIALALGFNNFRGLLEGARTMDEHFKLIPLQKNIPVVLALLDFWYNNFFDTKTHAFIPYDESLKLLPDYLAQLFMESNGKSASLSGHIVDYKTMPVTWGSIGTNAQHAFFQLLHQGTQLVPIDFLAPISKTGNQKHHALLLANCLAQSRTLMQGKDNSDPHKHLSGNKPSTTILYPELTPKILGTLIALFEHRTFVQGVLWNINSFDQWGVESGKKLATKIFENLNGAKINNDLDSSTQNLIDLYRQKNQ